jgi:hypothetical protein
MRKDHDAASSIDDKDTTKAHANHSCSFSNGLRFSISCDDFSVAKERYTLLATKLSSSIASKDGQKQTVIH